MQVECNECQLSVNIREEKLPKDQAFSIICPECKNKIKVAQHLKIEETPTTPASELKEELDASSMVSEYEDFEDDDELVIYEEGDQLALVLDEKNQTALTEVLKNRDYKIQYAKSPEHAVHKMKFTHFHFVALHENYGNKGLDNNPVYQTLIELPMVTRRNIFLALIGAKFKTLSNMQAFQKSANVVINEKDLEKLEDILKKTISENETFYKVFKETLHSMRKT